MEQKTYYMNVMKLRITYHSMDHVCVTAAFVYLSSSMSESVLSPSGCKQGGTSSLPLRKLTAQLARSHLWYPECRQSTPISEGVLTELRMGLHDTLSVRQLSNLCMTANILECCSVLQSFFYVVSLSVAMEGSLSRQPHQRFIHQLVHFDCTVVLSALHHSSDWSFCNHSWFHAKVPQSCILKSFADGGQQVTCSMERTHPDDDVLKLVLLTYMHTICNLCSLSIQFVVKDAADIFCSGAKTSTHRHGWRRICSFIDAWCSIDLNQIFGTNFNLDEWCNHWFWFNLYILSWRMICNFDFNKKIAIRHSLNTSPVQDSSGRFKSFTASNTAHSSVTFAFKPNYPRICL